MQALSLPANAEDLLPHTGLMCCIDRLLHVTGTTATADVALHAQHPLVTQKAFDREGFIELAAQTAGAAQGYAERSRSLPVRKGFLVGVQKFSVCHEATVGQVLTIFVETIAELDALSIVAFTVHCQDLLLAQGQLKVYVQADNAAILAGEMF